MLERLFHSLLPTNWAHYNLQYKASQLTTPNPTLPNYTYKTIKN